LERFAVAFAAVFLVVAFAAVFLAIAFAAVFLVVAFAAVFLAALFAVTFVIFDLVIMLFSFLFCNVLCAVIYFDLKLHLVLIEINFILLLFFAFHHIINTIPNRHYIICLTNGFPNILNQIQLSEEPDCSGGNFRQMKWGY
jgi:hypothetical protein